MLLRISDFEKNRSIHHSSYNKKSPGRNEFNREAILSNMLSVYQKLYPTRTAKIG